MCLSLLECGVVRLGMEIYGRGYNVGEIFDQMGSFFLNKF